MMDKSVLVQYNAMKEEIKDIRRRIEKDRRELERLNKLIVVDSVTCGKKGKKPLRTVKVHGRPETAISRKEAALSKHLLQLEQREAELVELTVQAEEYISSIEKSELRIMFRLYYLDGLTWNQVAHRMNQAFPKKKYTEDGCRMRNNRFFEKNL